MKQVVSMVKICRRCNRPVTVNADYYDIFEQMHWLCFHLEFEHGNHDQDEPCEDPSCPWNIINDKGQKSNTRRLNMIACKSNINLPFTIENLQQLLHEVTTNQKPRFSHRDLAYWCDDFWFAVNEGSLSDKPPKSTLSAADIALKIDAQWDLFVTNSFSLEQLNSLDLATVRLPQEWLEDWLNQLNELL